MVKVRVNRYAAGKEGPVRLFEVYNTSHRSLLVLATDRTEAVETAYAASHIHFIWDRKDKSYPHTAEVRNPINDRRFAYHVDLIQVALARGLRGTVHLDGENLCVGNEMVRIGE